MYDENSSKREYYRAKLRKVEEEVEMFKQLIRDSEAEIVYVDDADRNPVRERNEAAVRVFNLLLDANKLSHGKSFKEMLEDALERRKGTLLIDKTLRSFNE